MILALLTAMVLVVLLVYVVREATVLKTTAAALKTELEEFKTRGFDELIKTKIGALESVAKTQLEERERFLRQKNEEFSDQITKIHTGFGTVTAEIKGLHDLKNTVGELNDLLKPQQLRGELGELAVRSLLADKLPKQYEEDYTFSDGKKVEFVLRLSGKLIPIDSKFQIEDYKRLRNADERERPALRAEFKRKVRQKIDEVKQYIRPEEGTMNFALMVIASEAVFYELIANKDFTEDDGLYNYANTQNVFLASPLTFWAYVTTIERGLKGLEIERRAEEVLESLQSLATQIRNFAKEEFRIVGVHLRNANSQYDQAEKALTDVNQSLTNLERIGGPHRPQEEALS